MNLHWLDAAATTRLDERVLAAMLPYLRDEFANASSLHAPGVRARTALEEARRVLAGLGPPQRRVSRVVFTGSGSEANNLAILGVTAKRIARPTERILCSSVDHPSVQLACREAAARRGGRCEMLAVDRDGRLDLAALEAALDPEVALVAVLAVQNELGTIQPIAEAAALIRAKAPRAHFHVDAIQALGKLDLAPFFVADSLALSAHKIHGPKGIGALLLASDRPLAPQVVGGGQEGGIRAGTENVAAAVGFAAAVSLARQDGAETLKRLTSLRDTIEAVLVRRLGAAILGAGAPRAPTIVAARLASQAMLAETVMHALAGAGVVIGTGSACHATRSARGQPSPTHAAIGLDEAAARRVIRVSISPATTPDDVAALDRALVEAITPLEAALR
jgi:cysteine desulfurase